MKAMILAAGFGKRLGELTATTPKCLMPVGSSTVLACVIENLKAAGVHEIVINLHYLGDKIRSYIASRDTWGVPIVFSEEEIILGTGGGVKQAKRYLGSDEPFFLHNGDIYSELDLAAMYRAHVESSQNALATVAVIDRKTSRPLIFNAQGCLIGWQSKENNLGSVIAESSENRLLAFSGIQVISPALFEYIDADEGEFSIIASYMRAARAGRCVKAYPMDGAYWIDMGTPEKLAELRARVAAMQT